MDVNKCEEGCCNSCIDLVIYPSSSWYELLQIELQSITSFAFQFLFLVPVRYFPLSWESVSCHHLNSWTSANFLLPPLTFRITCREFAYSSHTPPLLRQQPLQCKDCIPGELECLYWDINGTYFRCGKLIHKNVVIAKRSTSEHFRVCNTPVSSALLPACGLTFWHPCYHQHRWYSRTSSCSSPWRKLVLFACTPFAEKRCGFNWNPLHNYSYVQDVCSRRNYIHIYISSTCPRNRGMVELMLLRHPLLERNVLSEWARIEIIFK